MIAFEEAKIMYPASHPGATPCGQRSVSIRMAVITKELPILVRGIGILVYCLARM
jgi:hypothetical protein